MAVCRLAVWARKEGIPLTPETVFHPNVVDRFALTGMNDLSVDTRGTRLSTVKRVARTVTKKAPWEPERVTMSRCHLQAPYSRDQAVHWWEIANTQRTPQRLRAARALVALGLGVGVSPNEHLLITGNRVIEQAGLVFVDIPGARARMVPCAHDWAERLVQVATGFPEAPLIGEDTPNRNRLFNLGKGIVVPPNFPRPTAARFRTTWMVGLLSRGVPFQGFTNATGWEQAQHLEDFVPYLYEWDTAELHRAIAGVPK